MHFLFKLFFRREIRAYEQAANDVCEKSEIEIRKAKYEANLRAEQYGLVQRAFSDFSSGKIVGLAENKNGESVFVFEHLCRDSLTICLYGKSYKAINRHPRIMCTIKENQQALDKYIHIEDIMEVDCNVGNGSILMTYLIREAKELEAKYIYGWLSDIDKNHFDRSEHFYRKHGFEVSLNQKRTSGHIKLIL